MNPLKSLRQRSCGCCLLLALLFLLLVGGLIFLIVRAADAEGAPSRAYDVVLVSDQSTSMWDCDGIGTDPNLLRVDATRLFINTLGTDSSARHRLALLYFGGEVEQIASLTDLADAAARQALIEAASNPRPMRWTDHLLALQAAGQLLLEASQPDSQRLIVLLTDGEPAPMPSAGYDDRRYLAALRTEANTLAQQKTTLAIVALTDTRTSCGRHATADWLGHWAELAETTPGGALFTASQAEDLLPVYHAIVRGMTGAGEGATSPTSATLSAGQPLTVTVPVTEPLASVILTIWKADPATTVQVFDPAGSVIAAGQPGVTVAGGGSAAHEEVWRVAQPGQGIWQVTLSGLGRVSVWQDRVPQPTAKPSASAPASPTTTASPTPTATASPTVAPTATPSPTPSATATKVPLALPRIIISTVTPKPTPAVSPTAPAAAHLGDAPAAPITGRLPLWPFLTGGVLGLSGIASILVVRGQGPFLTGQLAPIAVPADSTLVMPRDLGAEHRRQVHLGQRGEREWRLAGWPGTVQLTASGRGSVSISPVAGEATLNGQALHHPTALEDGAVIGCGAYQIRYENLLA